MSQAAETLQNIHNIFRLSPRVNLKKFMLEIWDVASLKLRASSHLKIEGLKNIWRVNYFPFGASGLSSMASC